MSVFGRSYGQRISGEVKLDGHVVDVSTVRSAALAGLAAGLAVVMAAVARRWPADDPMSPASVISR